MGLFDKVLGSDKLNEAESMAGVALCAIASDGTITEDETGGLAASLVRMKLYRGMNARDLNQMMQKCIRLLKEQGTDQFLENAAQAITPDLRPTAFAIAADLLMADGEVADQEHRFLERIQHALGVQEEMAVKIVEVLQIKNMG